MSLDIIGTIHDVSGETPVELDGYHVNSALLISGLDAYRVEPSTPSRVFGGGTTYFYTFESKEQADELLQDVEFIPAKEVPARVKSSSGLLVLAGLGLYDQLAEYMGSDIASVQEKIIYEREPYWYRNDALVTGMAAMFSLTTDQVDDLFIQAAAL